MKNIVFILFTLFLPTLVQAQEDQTEYNFLRIPVSAHGAALGGENITIIEDDASLVFSNPALLINVSDRTVNLNYMNYMHGANSLSAAYVMNVMERGQMSFGAQYMDYGNIKEMTAEGIQTGDFHPKDIALSGTFAYMLSDYFSGGVTAKFITSYIGQFNSMAVGVDLGLNYYNEESEWSVSAVAKNLGGQIKPYEDDYEAIPLDMQLGVSKRLVGSPLRLNATLVDLNHFSKLKNHLVFGADLILSSSTWVGFGYNLRRANEMTFGTGDEESSHGAGLSLGAGLNTERFKVNLAWGKYHVASSSLIINIAFNI